MTRSTMTWTTMMVVTRTLVTAVVVVVVVVLTFVVVAVGDVMNSNGLVTHCISCVTRCSASVLLCLSCARVFDLFVRGILFGSMKTNATV